MGSFSTLSFTSKVRMVIGRVQADLEPDPFNFFIDLDPYLDLKGPKF